MSLAAAWRRPGVRAGALVLALSMVVVGLDRALPPPLDRARNVSTVVSDADGHTLRVFPVEDGRWRLAADLDTIDPAFLRALIEIEDQRFYRHSGVDVRAVIRASLDALRRGEVRSGASTITMQTARLLEPRPRTLGAKLIEMIRALQLEVRLNKDEILELYLTLAPYGGNLEGVRAASWSYFGREPKELTPDQIALLIALPQAPEARRPDRRDAAAREARNIILTRIEDAGLLAADRAADAQQEPVPTRRAPFPAEAWHLAEAVRRSAPGAADIRSTLRIGLQREAERLTRALAQGADAEVQAATIIVHIPTRHVVAAVGSAGRERPGGWLDLTTRKRSPGSTLKPFIFAIAFDDGVAAPGTIISDLPARFASYRPENFDRTFRGEVTMAEALQHSLNIPAVYALDAVGAERFLAVLGFAGSAPVMPGARTADAGLAIALGGIGLSVRDMAVLYAALGDGGLARPLAFTLADAERLAALPGRQIISTESAGEVIDILAASPVPDGRMPAALAAAAPSIAFKTGTSYGFRDAWAAGVAGGYAVIVWTGHADGAPRAGATGRVSALPSLFEMFDAIARTDPTFFARARSTTRMPAPAPLSRFEPEDPPPRILFPPENVEVWADGPGDPFVLSARGQAPLRWYADGKPLSPAPEGATAWAPDGPGFYELSVVDAQGRTARVRVRVRMPAG